jgi:hypothetical protein
MTSKNQSGTQRREQLTEDITNRIHPAVQEECDTSATPLADEDRMAIEREILFHTAHVLDALTSEELTSEGALFGHISNARLEANRLIRNRKPSHAVPTKTRKADAPIPGTRETITAYIAQMVKNEVQRTLLLHAPERMPDERLDEIEEEVVRLTKERLERLSIENLSSPKRLGMEIWIAEGDTKDLIHQ